MDWLDEVKWDRDGLVPAIAQEASSGDVLMVAWMNRESLALTLQRGEAVYWSRSRGRLWHKGEESGHVQQVHEIRLDCDADVVLLKVTQRGHEPGIACHTGRHSCFYRRLDNGAWSEAQQAPVNDVVLARLAEVIESRLPANGGDPAKSYVAKLSAKGLDAVLKKVGEEAVEVVMAAKDGARDKVVYEVADLWFHSLVALAQFGLRPSDVLAELARREGLSGLEEFASRPG